MPRVCSCHTTWDAFREGEKSRHGIILGAIGIANSQLRPAPREL